MLGSLLKATVKTITLPVDIAIDIVSAPVDAGDNMDVGHRTKKKIDGIADDLDDVL